MEAPVPPTDQGFLHLLTTVFMMAIMVEAMPLVLHPECGQFTAEQGCVESSVAGFFGCAWCNSTATCEPATLTECPAVTTVVTVSTFVQNVWVPVSWACLVAMLMLLVVGLAVRIAYNQHQRAALWATVFVVACVLGDAVRKLPVVDSQAALFAPLLACGGLFPSAFQVMAAMVVVGAVAAVQPRLNCLPRLGGPVASTYVLADGVREVLKPEWGFAFEAVAIGAVRLWGCRAGEGSAIVYAAMPAVLAVLLLAGVAGWGADSLPSLLYRLSALPLIAMFCLLTAACTDRSVVQLFAAILVTPSVTYTTLAITCQNLRLWTLAELLPRWSVGMSKLALGVGVTIAAVAGARSAHQYWALALAAHCLIPGCFLLSLWYTAGRLNHSVFRQFVADTPVDDLAVVLIGLVVVQVTPGWQVYLPAMVVVSWCGLVCYPVRCVVLGGVLRGGVKVGSLKKYLWVIPVPVVVLMVMLVSVEEDKWESLDWYVMSSGVCSLVQYVCGVWMSEGVKAVVTQRHDSAVVGGYQVLEAEEGKAVRPTLA